MNQTLLHIFFSEANGMQLHNLKCMNTCGKSLPLILTSRVIVLPVSVFTKICILPPLKKRKNKSALIYLFWYIKTFFVLLFNKGLFVQSFLGLWPFKVWAFLVCRPFGSVHFNYTLVSLEVAG